MAAPTRVKRITMTDRDRIIRDINALYEDRRYSLDEAFDNMRTIEEAARTNANALADDIAGRNRRETL